MLNEIVKGISLALNTAFGDGYAIYQDDVEQGLEEPCFFISVLSPQLSPLVGWRSVKRNPFDILYFPTAPGKNAEMFDIAETMMECLAQIRLPNGDLLRGTGMHYEVADDVLHFMVNYNLILSRREEKESMETLESRQQVKNDG